LRLEESFYTQFIKLAFILSCVGIVLGIEIFQVYYFEQVGIFGRWNFERYIVVG
jgi:hypothetical protein